MRVFRIVVAVFLLAGSVAWAGEAAPVKASKTDRCPVCGMFVAKYPDFLAQVIFKDGAYALFDGAKDMFKYLFNLKKYNPSKEPAEIAGIFVADYYNLSPTDGRRAYYVVESDVFGPMGKELIPFEKETDAQEFMKDHLGKKLLRFEEVTPELIKELQ